MSVFIMHTKSVPLRRPFKTAGRSRGRAEARARFMGQLPTPTDEEFGRQRELFEKHDAVAYSIRLPLAPTVNNYRTVVTIGGRARLMTTSEGQEYHAAVKHLWIARWKGRPPEPLTGRLRLLVSIVFATSPPPDLDNRVKPLQDALVYAGAFADDNQVDDLRVIRAARVARPGWMDVTIETAETETCRH